MDKVLEFLSTNWIGVLIVIVFAVYQLYSIRNRGLRQTAYKLFLQAEKLFPDKMGADKMGWVVQQFYPNLPPWIKLVISADSAEMFLHIAYREAKDFLDDGKFNDSCI